MAMAALVSLLITANPDSAANTLDAITWGHDLDGTTTVTIVCAEPIDGSSVRSFAIPDPPRAVVAIEGITNRVQPDVMVIEDRNVIRLRLGYRGDASAPELNVILDLATAAAQILDLRHTGKELVAVIGSPNQLTATPVSEPSPTPPPQPTETPTPSTAVASPRSVPSFPDQPAPPVLPVKVATPTAVPSPTSPPNLSDPASLSPTAKSEPELATRIIDVVTNLRSDGSTLLRVTADGRLPNGCARTLKISDEPPRIILSLRGMTAPDLPRTIDVGDPNLDRIRLVHDAETSAGELHLVLQLERPGVSVIELKQIGPHLVAQLAVEAAPTLIP